MITPQSSVGKLVYVPVCCTQALIHGSRLRTPEEQVYDNENGHLASSSARLPRSIDAEAARRRNRTPAVHQAAFNHTVRGNSPQTALQQMLCHDSISQTAVPPNSEASIEFAARPDRKIRQGETTVQTCSPVIKSSSANGLAAWQMTAAGPDTDRYIDCCKDVQLLLS